MGHLHMICIGIKPGAKVVEINELMDSIMEPDIEMEPQDITTQSKTQSWCCSIQI